MLKPSCVVLQQCHDQYVVLLGQLRQLRDGIEDTRKLIAATRDIISSSWGAIEMADEAQARRKPA